MDAGHRSRRRVLARRTGSAPFATLLAVVAAALAGAGCKTTEETNFSPPSFDTGGVEGTGGSTGGDPGTGGDVGQSGGSDGSGGVGTGGVSSGNGGSDSGGSAGNPSGGNATGGDGMEGGEGNATGGTGDGGDTGGVGTTGGSATGGSGGFVPTGAFCADFTQRIVDCEVVGEGVPRGCAANRVGREACENECLAEASCDDVFEHFCFVDGALTECLDACVESEPFVCGDDSEIDPYFLCDGIVDCEDESDEPEGCRFTCGGDEFPVYFQCDGFEDCADGSDEPSDCAADTCF